MIHPELEKSNPRPLQGTPGLLHQARAPITTRSTSSSVTSSQRIAGGRGQPPPATPEDSSPRATKTTYMQTTTIDLKEVKAAKAFVGIVQNSLQTPGTALLANLPDVLKALKPAENLYTALLQGQCTNNCNFSLETIVEKLDKLKHTLSHR